MRKIANLFLIFFLLVAGLDIFRELLNPYWPDSPIVGFSSLARILLMLLAVPVYLGLGFNRHLTKRVFVPLLVFLLWSLLDFWPLAVVAGSHYALFAACGQLLLGLLVLKSIRWQNEESLLLTRSQFEGSGFRTGTLFGFCLLSIPLLPVILMLLGYAATSSLIEEYTAGFVRLKPNGLYLVEKIYTQDAKKIRLAGMIHLGQKEYYQELSTSFSAGNTLLLAEGVSDKKGLLTDRFSYGNLADMLGMTSQEEISFDGRLIEVASLDQSDVNETGKADILRADLDLQDFDPRTIKVLNAIGTYLLNGTSLSSGYREFKHWAEQNITPEINQVLIDDLLKKRNRAVLSYLPKALHKYQTLLIPWGALHMPGIEAAVKEQGFTLQETHERQAIDFLILPYGQLWENLTAATWTLSRRNLEPGSVSIRRQIATRH